MRERLMWVLCGLTLIAFNLWCAGVKADPLPSQLAIDVSLANEYWQQSGYIPSVPTCGSLVITEQVMLPALAGDGTILPPSDIWAETVPSSCDIDISPDLWTYPGLDGEYFLCATITHEDGHSLGWPDDTGPDMMNTNWIKQRQQPLCAAYYLGRRHLTRYERHWLKVNAPANGWTFEVPAP